MADEALHPEVLLVGPRVVHLAPFFERRGYRVDAHVDGTEALTRLQGRHKDLVVLELQVGELGSVDFITAAKSARPDARFILLDEVSRAGQIVKSIVAGLHAYVATPPDEQRLFLEVDRLMETAPRFRPSAETIGALESQVQSLHGQVVEISMRADMLQQELDTNALELESVKADLDAARTEIDEKDRAFELLDAQSAAMPSEDEYANLRARSDAADKLEKEIAKLKKILADRDESIADLERRLKDTSTRHSEAATKLALNDEIVHDIEGHKARADAAETRSKELAARANRVDPLEKSVADAKKEIEKLQLKLDEKQKALHAADDTKAAAILRQEELERTTQMFKERCDAAEKLAKSEAERVRRETQADVDAANTARDKAEERAIDRELETDDLRARISELEAAVKAHEESLRREKLRFVEQQELSGNDDVYRKMETMSHELGRLRRERDAYEKQFGKVSEDSN